MNTRLVSAPAGYVPLLAVVLSGCWYVAALIVGADPVLTVVPVLVALIAYGYAHWGGSRIGAGVLYGISSLVMLVLAVIASGSIGWYLLPAIACEVVACVLALRPPKARNS